MMRVQRSRAVELWRAAFGVDGTALFDGGNRDLVADAQRVAMRRRCFRRRCRSELRDVEPDGGGGDEHLGQTETTSCVFTEVASSSELASFWSSKLLDWASVRE